MAREQAADEPDLIDEKQPEAQAQQTGRHPKVALDVRQSPGGVRHRRRDDQGDEHHSHDGAEAEEHEVRHRPSSVADGREHEERHRRRAGQAVDQAHHERADDLVDAEPAEPSIEPGLRRPFFGMPVILRPVSVPVTVHVVAVSVRVSVRRGAPAELVANRLDESGEVPQPEHDQHEGRRHLHREAEGGRDHDAEDDDRAADDDDGQGVAESPQAADQHAAAQRPLPRHDRADGDDVIRVRGVAHSEEEPERDERERGDHVRLTW